MAAEGPVQSPGSAEGAMSASSCPSPRMVGRGGSHGSRSCGTSDASPIAPTLSEGAEAARFVSGGRSRSARRGGDSRAATWRRRVVSGLKRPWKRQQQAPSWDSVRTVELHEEEQLLHAEQQAQDFFGRWLWTMQGWVMPMSVGICCFFTYVLIEGGIGALSSMRFGYCRDRPFRPKIHCPEGSWTEWGGGAFGCLASVCFGTTMAAASAWLVTRIAPAASGSGIPEVKTILNGFVLPDVATARTLLIKVPGLILAVSSGMALGHEGPMVHVAVCWAQLLSRFSQQYQHEGKRRELFSAAVAAGVSVAFGTPVGGVLFSLEEVSSHFSSRTLLQAFIASVVGTLALSVSHLSGEEELTLFSVRYTSTCHPGEYLVFALLGITGGLVGALFNAVNIRWAAFRMKPAFKQRVTPVVEVIVVSLLTLVTSWPLALTRPLMPDAIHALFDTCDGRPGQTHRSKLQADIGLCTPEGQQTQADARLLSVLGAAAAIRFCQMAVTIGTACPAGLFVPSLFVGACLGRCTGGAVRAINANARLFKDSVDPGVYSMVGAAAVLGGVCRMTISLVVIMLELTGGLDYVVPFMLSVLLAKAVGDAVNESIYDLQIVLKGYPFLHEELDVTFTERCCDIMVTRLTKLDLRLRPRLGDLKSMLASCTYRGFPIVDGEHFIGYLRRSRLEALVQRLDSEARAEDSQVSPDLLPCTDSTVMRMVPDAPLSQAHQVFKQLGCQHIFVVGAPGPASETSDALLGMLSKKSFLRFLKDGRVGHMPAQPTLSESRGLCNDRAELLTAFEAAEAAFGCEGEVRSDGTPNEHTEDEWSDDVFGSGLSGRSRASLRAPSRASTHTASSAAAPNGAAQTTTHSVGDVFLGP